MKIAMPVDGGKISQHFGHCESFVVYEIEENRVKNKTVIANPGHAPGVLPQLLIDHGVSCLIAGGIGSNAQRLFKDAGVTPMAGASGDTDQVIQEYLDGKLEIGENSCDH